MKNTLETRLGIFVALAAIAGVLILEIVGGIDFFRRGYKVSSLFDTVQELKVGDRVKMAGVEVGRVEDIRLEPEQNKVRVTMKLTKGTMVRTDSTATIRFAGLMGQNFVLVDFGTPDAAPARDGTQLTAVEQPDFAAMMQKLDNVASGIENITKSFTGEKIDNLLGPFTDFLKANREPLTATFANLKAISTQISQGQGTVGKLIYDDALHNSALTTVTNLQGVAGDVQLAIGDVRHTLTQVRSVVDQVNAGKGTVGKLLTDDTLYRETTNSMTNLREILQKINQGQGSVGKLVNEEEFYRNAKLTLQKLDKATEGLEDQGPLSVMGIVVNKLF